MCELDLTSISSSTRLYEGHYQMLCLRKRLISMKLHCILVMYGLYYSFSICQDGSHLKREKTNWERRYLDVWD